MGHDNLLCVSQRNLSPYTGLPTGEFQNTRYTEWCPGWCWPTVDLPDHSHNSWHCQEYTGLAAVHFLLSIIYLLTHFQNLGFLWMEMISYPASKRIKNYLFKRKKKKKTAILCYTLPAPNKSFQSINWRLMMGLSQALL